MLTYKKNKKVDYKKITGVDLLKNPRFYQIDPFYIEEIIEVKSINEIVQDETTPTYILEDILFHKANYILKVSQSNYFRDSYSQVRFNIARNPNINIEILKVLADDNAIFIVYEIYEILKNDVKLYQLYTQDRIDFLSEFHCEYVSFYKYKIEIFEKMILTDHFPIKEIIAIDEETPVNILFKLSQDKDNLISKYAFQNESYNIENYLEEFAKN